MSRREAYTAPRSNEFSTLVDAILLCSTAGVILFSLRVSASLLLHGIKRASLSYYATVRETAAPKGEFFPSFLRRAARIGIRPSLMCDNNTLEDEANTELFGQHHQDVGLLFAIQSFAAFDKTVHRFR